MACQSTGWLESLHLTLLHMRLGVYRTSKEMLLKGVSHTASSSRPHEVRLDVHRFLVYIILSNH